MSSKLNQTKQSKTKDLESNKHLKVLVYILLVKWNHWLTGSTWSTSNQGHATKPRACNSTQDIQLNPGHATQPRTCNSTPAMHLNQRHATQLRPCNSTKAMQLNPGHATQPRPWNSTKDMQLNQGHATQPRTCNSTKDMQLNPGHANLKLHRQLWCRQNKNETSNWSSVGYLKCVQFYNWFRLHQTLDQL